MYVIKTGVVTAEGAVYVGAWAHEEHAQAYADALIARGGDAKVIKCRTPDVLPPLPRPRIQRTRRN